MNRFINKYKSELKNNNIFYDINQEYIVNRLNNVFKNIILENKTKGFRSLFNKLNFSKNNESLGLYIWGGVGRGKTYLVDLFFCSLEIKEKLRVHFYHFMNLIHIKLKEFSGIKDPIKLIAKWFFDRYKIICLDEFFVKDIGDAMILAKLFYYFFEYKIIFVITSNVIPCNLYMNGLQRQKFINTVYLLEKKLEVLNINGNNKIDIDYRLKNLGEEDIYLYPLSLMKFKLFRSIFFKLSTIPPNRKGYINILNRKISYIYISGSVIWFDFNVICGYGRSQLDYIELASLFNTVFISGLKLLTSFDEDKVRRFICLIDEFYDRKINVIILSDVDINFLYNGEILKFDFERTRSRLMEMKTKDYLKESRSNEL